MFSIPCFRAFILPSISHAHRVQAAAAGVPLALVVRTAAYQDAIAAQSSSSRQQNRNLPLSSRTGTKTGLSRGWSLKVPRFLWLARNAPSKLRELQRRIWSHSVAMIICQGSVTTNSLLHVLHKRTGLIYLAKPGWCPPADSANANVPVFFLIRYHLWRFMVLGTPSKWETDKYTKKHKDMFCFVKDEKQTQTEVTV